MVFYIKQLYQSLRYSSEKKVVVENFLSLAVLQAVQSILPLVTLPYLVRVLGPEKFGLVSFAAAAVYYFNIITDYSFNLSATREISIYRDDRRKLIEIFNAVMAIKLILVAVSFAVLCGIVFLYGKFRQEWPLYLLSFGAVAGNALFPIWFFQGMERMKFITVLQIIGRLIFTILVFWVIKRSGDYLRLPVVIALGFMVPGVASLIVVWRRFQIQYAIPSAASMIHQLKEGWHIFIANVAVSAYTLSNTVILGFVAPLVYVGYYAAAERIIRAVMGFMTPVSLALYPYITKLVHRSRRDAVLFIRKVIAVVGIANGIVSLLLFFFARVIERVILGTSYTESVVVLEIMAFLPFIVGLSNIFGMQTMLPFNLKEVFSKMLVMAGIINVTLALCLAPSLKHIGVAISVLLTEIFVTVVMLTYLVRKKILAVETIA